LAAAPVQQPGGQQTSQHGSSQQPGGQFSGVQHSIGQQQQQGCGSCGVAPPIAKQKNQGRIVVRMVFMMEGVLDTP
jgi:hypothetical protein